ncbi:MAG: transcriptional regulator [Clostridia bacterium]|nr:transcriptional regulator [Clostridia bacterium]
MNDPQETMISLDEARTALRCMRLSGLSEEEELEDIDDFTQRLRNVTAAGLVGYIIENRLSDTQRLFLKERWFSRKNTAQIAREHGVSQPNVYQTIARAENTVRDYMTPVIMYSRNILDPSIVPINYALLKRIRCAGEPFGGSMCEIIRDIRLSNAVGEEQFCTAVGISRKELEVIEKGKKMPTIPALLACSAVFGAEIRIKLTEGKGDYKWKKA